MFGTEYELDCSIDDTILFFYLCLPFGFSGSPGIFGGIMEAVQFYRRSFIPCFPVWGDSLPFTDEVFVGDWMLSEASIGRRKGVGGSFGARWRLFFLFRAISTKQRNVGGRMYA